MNDQAKKIVADTPGGAHTPDHYVITPDDRQIIVSALRQLAVVVKDRPSRWAKITALAVHIETAKVLSS